MRHYTITLLLILSAAHSAIEAQTPAEEVIADLAATHVAMAEIFTHDALTLDDGAKLAWHIRAGSGPNLVLIPGSWGDYFVFNRLLPHLDPNLRIIIVELRGHGDSMPAMVNGTMERFADDVMTVIEHLKLERYFVSGHSIGGMLAVEIAGRNSKGLSGVMPIEGWTHHTVQANAFGHLPDFPLSPEHAAERQANRDRGVARLTEAERQEFGKSVEEVGWERGVEKDQRARAGNLGRPQHEPRSGSRHHADPGAGYHRNSVDSQRIPRPARGATRGGG